MDAWASKLPADRLAEHVGPLESQPVTVGLTS